MTAAALVTARLLGQSASSCSKSTKDSTPAASVLPLLLYGCALSLLEHVQLRPDERAAGARTAPAAQTPVLTWWLTAALQLGLATQHVLILSALASSAQLLPHCQFQCGVGLQLLLPCHMALHWAPRQLLLLCPTMMYWHVCLAPVNVHAPHAPCLAQVRSHLQQLYAGPCWCLNEKRKR
jgi:hypothetical protein